MVGRSGQWATTLWLGAVSAAGIPHWSGPRLRSPARPRRSNAQVELDVGAPCTTQTIARTSGLGRGRYCMPHTAGEATMTMQLGSQYEPATHSMLEHYLRRAGSPGDVVTAGLYFGDYLPHLSRSVGAGHRVYGFEPVLDSFLAARGTIAASSLGNVYTANVALGNESRGSVLFCLQNGGNGGSHVVLAGSGACDPRLQQRVPVSQLDDLLPPERRINAIHLDVEGAELKALHGAQRTIRRWRPLVVCETGTPGDQEPEVIAFMQTLGYSIAGHADRNTFFRI